MKATIVVLSVSVLFSSSAEPAVGALEFFNSLLDAELILMPSV